MSNATELLRRAADALRSELGPVPPYYIYGLIQEMEEHFLASEPETEKNCYGDGNVYRGVRSNDSEIETIFIRSEQARKPMTKEEIDSKFALDGSMFSSYAAFKQGVRFAEKHHGIGGEDE